jgi:cobalt-zinc-cadmium efflux system outer membrane protein
MFHITVRGLLLAATLGVPVLSGPAVADPAPPFRELLRQAQATAPRLAEARADVARAEGLSRQAGALPNPTLGLEVENFSGSGPFRGTSFAETTATIGQRLELGGKRSSRAAAGRAEVEAARLRAARGEKEYAFDLAVAYATAEASDRRLQLAEEGLTLAEEDARIASAFVDAGREPELRRVQARAAVGAARANVDDARAARATAFSNLTALAGAPAPLTSIQVSLLDESLPPNLGRAIDSASAPGFLAARAEREAAVRRLQVERRRAIPDVEVSVGLRRFEEADATALIAGVSVPLPIFDRNRGAIGAARAEIDAANARLNAARLEAEAAARSANARTTAAESRLTAAREGETAAQEAYRLTRIGYEAGKLDLAELIAARRALTEARSQVIAAGVERVGAQAAIARLSATGAQGESR